MERQFVFSQKMKHDFSLCLGHWRISLFFQLPWQQFWCVACHRCADSHIEHVSAPKTWPDVFFSPSVPHHVTVCCGGVDHAPESQLAEFADARWVERAKTAPEPTWSRAPSCSASVSSAQEAHVHTAAAPSTSPSSCSSSSPTRWHPEAREPVHDHEAPEATQEAHVSHGRRDRHPRNAHRKYHVRALPCPTTSVFQTVSSTQQFAFPSPSTTAAFCRQHNCGLCQTTCDTTSVRLKCFQRKIATDAASASRGRLFILRGDTVGWCRWKFVLRGKTLSIEQWLSLTKVSPEENMLAPRDGLFFELIM